MKRRYNQHVPLWMFEAGSMEKVHDFTSLQKPLQEGDAFELPSRVVYTIMPFKVREILLVSSLYDAFIIEEEGLISEMVIGEYRDLQLSSPPRITRVPSGRDALEKISKGRFDLVITMSKNIGMDPFVFGKKIKELSPNLPVFLLATESSDLKSLEDRSHNGGIDQLFFWSGDSNLFLAIVKYIEDKVNAAFDTKTANVRVIILIEDSIRYYSMFLPLLYTEIVHQTERSISEDVNEVQRLLRRRARPKILLAKTFEEAMSLYQTYKHNVLGIISDIGFPRNKKIDAKAGFRFAEEIRKDQPFLPILLQSSHREHKDKAAEIGVIFLDKRSPVLLQDIHRFLLDYLGFGDFIFYVPIEQKQHMPDEQSFFQHLAIKEIARAETMEQFEHLIQTVPVECIRFHANRNDFSNWLMARGEFTLATIIKEKSISEFKDFQEVRVYLQRIFNETRRNRQLGVLTDFEQQTFEFDNSFTRIGGDSIGGKGRGIAFIRSLLYRYNLEKKYPTVRIIVPNTVAIGTEEFDAFLEDNELREKMKQKSLTDREIAHVFMKAKLRQSLKDKLLELLKHFTSPLAVRSSSLLEDSQNHPFAGMYATYMIQNNHEDASIRLNQLCTAIKLVYASVFYRGACRYIQATSASAEEEKMAIIIQEIIGRNHDNLFFPTFSGVAQSYNYYPVGRQKASEGIVSVAVGLGTAVVGGENVLRFSPRYPQYIPDFSSTDQILENAQKKMYVLDVSKKEIQLTEDEKDSLKKIAISDIPHPDVFRAVMSHFNVDDGMIRDGFSNEFPNLVTFAGVLKYNEFPLPSLLDDILKIGKDAMGCPVEIEFAVNLPDGNGEKLSEFAVLQIRPLIVSREQDQVVIDKSIKREKIFLRSDRALGHGVISTIHDIVYVKPESFDSSKTFLIAQEIEKINETLAQDNRHCILIGPGRWGTQDRWLGIPVYWGQISQAKVIVETDLADFHVKPSQGTHFLQNIIAQGVCYINIPYGVKDNSIDLDWLSKQKIVTDADFVRHINTTSPFVVRIDGKTRNALVEKP